MKTDFKKIMEQDQEFKEYAKDVMVKIFLDTNPGVIAMVYSMYQSGNTSESAANIFKMMMRFGGGDDKPWSNS